VWTRLLALFAITGSVLACGGRVDLGNADSIRADASTTGDAGSGVDANAANDAGAPVEDASMPADQVDGVACGEPTPASLAMTWCMVSSSPESPCDASQYEVTCAAPRTWPFSPLAPDVRCNPEPRSGSGVFCCPCLSGDAGPLAAAPDASACVNIDLSDFDTSCSADSDCTSVSSGAYCPSTCKGVCPNAAINRDGEARYEQTLAQASGSGEFCECGSLSLPDTYCNHGVCTYCGYGAPVRCPPQTGP
jgi:hypothetical protein